MKENPEKPLPRSNYSKPSIFGPVLKFPEPMRFIYSSLP
jgi:hypothetical protein